MSSSRCLALLSVKVLVASMVPVAATSAQTITTRKLVYPPTYGGRAVAASRSLIGARVGTTEYTVAAVGGRNTIEPLRVIVVLDLASTPPRLHGCLLQQAEDALLTNNASHVAKFIVVPAVRSHVRLDSFAWGSDWFSFVLGLGAEPDCSEARGRRADWRPSLSDFDLSGRVSRGLIEYLGTEQGPIRVLWIGQTFDWFTFPPFRESLFESNDVAALTPPNPLFFELESMCTHGVAIFPTVWCPSGSRVNGSDGSKHAQALARFAGGRMLTCDSTLSECLPKLLAATEEGLLLTIVGPPAKRRRGLWPAELELTYVQDELRFRQFLRFGTGEHRLVPSHWQTRERPWTLLFADPLTPGGLLCKGSHMVSLALPPRVSINGGKSLRAYIEAEDAQGAQWNVRLSPEPPGRHGETTDVCVDTSGVLRQASRARVILFDPDLSWAGIARVGRTRD